MSKKLSFILRFGLVGVCLYLTFRGVDWTKFGEALSRFGLWHFFGAVVFSLLQYIPLAWRLTFLTKGRADFMTALKAGVFCLGVNNLFPAKLGEVAKAFYLRKRSGVPLGQGLGLIFWERFFDLNTLLAIGLIAALFLRIRGAIAPLAIIVASIWLFLAFVRFFPDKAQALAKFVPGEKLKLLYAEVLQQLKDHFQSKFFLVLGAYSVVVWTLFAAVVAVVVLWVAKLPLTPMQALAVFVMSSFGYAIPSSPGALGVVEFAFVTAVGWFLPEAKEEALAAALVMRFISYVPPTLAALWVMARSGLTLRDIKRQNLETEAP